MAVPNFPAIVTIYELDNPKITATVVVRNGNIVDIDPALRLFIGKTLPDLTKWLERHGETKLTLVESKSDTRKDRDPYE
jgi:ribosome-associated translation inhibitor RaiA